MTRHTMSARSQGKPYTQRAMARMECDDVHRWVFAHSMDPGVEFTVRKNLPLDCVCDLGYGIAPSTVIDKGTVPLPDYHVLWPGKPTTNTVWTAVEDYTWFEAFSEEGCATGISCTPAPHMR